ncbi:acyl carrier protein [Chromobacterium sp. TRC.1.1.SA]|uniref:Acyl carrier protein n=1 Tax=Chromobacterium indicum TaxID=3110228 RepID=A0ABV0CL01_9NEIS|nr:acyl carrier protein [Chromobacterium vaccinii]
MKDLGSERGALEERVRAVLHLTLGAKIEKIQPAARLIDDLYADSMELLEMVMSLNDEFGIEIGAVDVAGMRTVADVREVVTRCLAKAWEMG